MARAEHPYELHLNYMVSRLERVIRAEIIKQLRELDLSVPQYTALTLLAAQGPLSNAQLARSSYVSPQAMNQVLAVLEEKGIVKRSPRRDHQRIQPAQLTAKGKRVTAAADAAARAVEARMMQGVSQRDQAAFARTIKQAIDALGYPLAVEKDAPTALEAGRRLGTRKP